MTVVLDISCLLEFKTRYRIPHVSEIIYKNILCKLGSRGYISWKYVGMKQVLWGRVLFY